MCTICGWQAAIANYGYAEYPLTYLEEFTPPTFTVKPQQARAETGGLPRRSCAVRKDGKLPVNRVISLSTSTSLRLSRNERYLYLMRPLLFLVLLHC